MSCVLIPMGTRPEIIKLSPVIRALREAGLAVPCAGWFAGACA